MHLSNILYKFSVISHIKKPISFIYIMPVFRRKRYVRKVARKPMVSTKRRARRTYRGFGMVPAQKNPFGNQGEHVYRNLLAGSIFPRQQWQEFRYSETITLNTQVITGLMGPDYYFNLGSLYDPNFSGIGHQPYRYDQLTPMYALYTVTKCKVRIEIVQAGATGMCLGIYFKPTISAYAVQTLYPADVREKAANIIMSAPNDNDGSPNKVFETIVKQSEVLGVPESAILSDDLYSAAVTASPVRSTLMGLSAGSWLLSLNTPLTINVSLVYTARLSGQLETAQS